jgi:hypothetical protein
MKKRRIQDNEICTTRIFQFNGNFDNLNNSDELTFPFSKVVDDFRIEKVKKFSDANLILFSDYTLYDQNYTKLPYKERCNYRIFAINGIDMLANKKLLADRLINTKLIPKSYSLDNNEAKKELLETHDPSKIYIIKANRQQQKGLLITKDINFIVNEAWKEQYVVAQELLQNPYLVNGRKINLRVYLLIIIKGNLCDWFIYNDGFLYYSPEYWEKGNTTEGVNITTGLKDRAIYKDNPLTHQDLYKIMDPNKVKLLQNNIINCFSTIHKLFRDDLVKKNKGSPGIKLSIFGCDIAPDENLNVTLMEINKGPSLDKKDDRDGELKSSMVRDAFGVIDIISGDSVNSKNFIEIN